MPDWRKDEDYAFTENLSAEGWAWEFLRRNHKYKLDYESVKTLVANEQKKFGPIPTDIWMLSKDVPHTIHFIPDKKPEESRRKWIHRCLAEDKEPNVFTHEQWIAKKWHLKYWMPSPGEDEPELYFIKEGGGAELLTWDNCSQFFYDASEGEDQGIIRQTKESVVIVFNAEKAITPQLNQAKEILKERKNSLKLPSSSRGQGKNKTDRDALCALLRIYDAEQATPKPSTSGIAALLFPDKKDSIENDYAVSDTIRKKSKRANELVMEDYLQCLLMSDIQKK